MGKAEQEQKQSGKQSLNRSRWLHCLFEDTRPTECEPRVLTMPIGCKEHLSGFSLSTSNKIRGFFNPTKGIKCYKRGERTAPTEGLRWILNTSPQDQLFKSLNQKSPLWDTDGMSSLTNIQGSTDKCDLAQQQNGTVWVSMRVMRFQKRPFKHWNV